MKTIKRYSFENEIKYYGKTYYWNPVSSARNKPSELDSLKVEVYNRNLQGVRDLHGNLYKPSVFYYSLHKSVNL